MDKVKAGSRVASGFYMGNGCFYRMNQRTKQEG